MIYCTALHMSTQPRNTKKSNDFRSRLWAFTLNNYTLDEVKELLTLKECEYVFQEEKGEETGTIHLQGFLKFKNAKTLSAVKKVNARMHLEVGRNEFALKAYCTKAATRNGKIWSNLKNAQVTHVQNEINIYKDDFIEMKKIEFDESLKRDWIAIKINKTPEELNYVIDWSKSWTSVDPDVISDDSDEYWNSILD